MMEQTDREGWLCDVTYEPRKTVLLVFPGPGLQCAWEVGMPRDLPTCQDIPL